MSTVTKPLIHLNGIINYWANFGQNQWSNSLNTPEALDPNGFWTDNAAICPRARHCLAHPTAVKAPASWRQPVECPGWTATHRETICARRSEGIGHRQGVGRPGTLEGQCKNSQRTGRSRFVAQRKCTFAADRGEPGKYFKLFFFFANLPTSNCSSKCCPFRAVHPSTFSKKSEEMFNA